MNSLIKLLCLLIKPQRPQTVIIFYTLYTAWFYSSVVTYILFTLQYTYYCHILPPGQT